MVGDRTTCPGSRRAPEILFRETPFKAADASAPAPAPSRPAGPPDRLPRQLPRARGGLSRTPGRALDAPGPPPVDVRGPVGLRAAARAARQRIPIPTHHRARA